MHVLKSVLLSGVLEIGWSISSVLEIGWSISTVGQLITTSPISEAFVEKKKKKERKKADDVRHRASITNKER